MIQDLHSHTYYSYCGIDSPEAVIKNAIEKGYDVIGISDHYYGIVMNKPGFMYANEKEKVIMHNNALKRYYEHIRLLAEKYKSDIDVWCGVEINTTGAEYTLMPEGVDVSIFDYCLIESFQHKNSVVDDIFDFAKLCKCERVGLAHVDLPTYINEKGFDKTEFFKQMAANNIFWEMNVNYDSIHNYREHQYVKEFFNNTELVEMIRKNNVKISVGFDGHDLDDYDSERVVDANNMIDKLNVEKVK